jgi:hypothetical protein
MENYVWKLINKWETNSFFNKFVVLLGFLPKFSGNEPLLNNWCEVFFGKPFLRRKTLWYSVTKWFEILW